MRTLFTRKKVSSSCAIIMDIGSGSVGVCLVVFTGGEQEMIWAHREHALLRNVDDLSQAQKNVSMAMVNAFLELSSSGMKALRSHNPALKPDRLQVSISAPWAYTVLRTVQYSSEHPFTVDDDLITELTDSAKKQVGRAINENELLRNLHLRPITQTVAGTRLNGYPVQRVDGQEGRSLTLSLVYSVAQESLLEALEESHTKIVPNTTLTTHPFMYAMFRVMQSLQPNTSEACLIDVNNEATQIGIVRNDTLCHITHTAFGSASIAREIATICSIPLEEAYTYLKGDDAAKRAKLSAKQQEEIDTMYASYENKVAELFKNTGDQLSIPKSLFLHTDLYTEEFFSQRIKKAAQSCTGLMHTIHPITSTLLNGSEVDDTALMLSTRFYSLSSRA